MRNIFIKNKRKPVVGSIKVVKMDRCNIQKKLSDAKFNLYMQNLNNEEYKLIFEGLKTDNDGILIIENLNIGKYKLIETEAPNGYINEFKEVVVDIKTKNNELYVEQKLILIYNKQKCQCNCNCCKKCCCNRQGCCKNSCFNNNCCKDNRCINKNNICENQYNNCSKSYKCICDYNDNFNNCNYIYNCKNKCSNCKNTCNCKNKCSNCKNACNCKNKCALSNSVNFGYNKIKKTY